MTVGSYCLYSWNIKSAKDDLFKKKQNEKKIGLELLDGVTSQKTCLAKCNVNAFLSSFFKNRLKGSQTLQSCPKH